MKYLGVSASIFPLLLRLLTPLTLQRIWLAALLQGA